MLKYNDLFIFINVLIFSTHLWEVTSWRALERSCVLKALKAWRSFLFEQELPKSKAKPKGAAKKAAKSATE
jgi:hypothetical protein